MLLQRLLCQKVPLDGLASNAVHFPDFPLTGFRRRTPGPPPFVDELHAGTLKGASYDLKGRASRLAPLLFELVDSHDADVRAIRQVPLAPAK